MAPKQISGAVSTETIQDNNGLSGVRLYYISTVDRPYQARNCNTLLTDDCLMIAVLSDVYLLNNK